MKPGVYLAFFLRKSPYTREIFHFRKAAILMQTIQKRSIEAVVCMILYEKCSFPKSEKVEKKI